LRLTAGQKVAERYIIDQTIGVGGMSVVYRAHDEKLDRYVTLKVLKDEYLQDDDFILKIPEEAKAAASLNHQNIVSIFDHGHDGDIHFIVLEYVEGASLKDFIKRKAPFDNDTILAVTVQIAEGIAEAHRSQIVHRDIKPQNILVTPQNVIKVADFGIARKAKSDTLNAGAGTMGSVHYFSPEQARGGYVDHKTDIYSLGVCMYEMATGRLPFDGEKEITVALQHINDPFPDILDFNPDVSENVMRIIEKATAKSTSARYQSADDMINDLRLALSSTATDFAAQMDDPIPTKVVKVLTEEDARRQRERAAFLDGKELEEPPKFELLGEKKYDPPQPPIHEEPDDYEEPYEPPYEEKYDDEPFDELYEEPYEDEEPYEESYEEPPYEEPQDEYEEKYEEKPSEYDKFVEYEDFDEEKPIHIRKKPDKVAVYGGIMLGVLFVVLITVGIWFVRDRFFARDWVTIPNLIGLSLDEARDVAAENDLDVYVISLQYSEYVEYGLVIDQLQTPEATGFTAGDVVQVIMSNGPEVMEILPNVTRFIISDARDALEARGLEIEIINVYDDDIPRNTVISQEPAAQTPIAAGALVVLTVSQGPEHGPIEMPNLLGLTEAAALDALRDVRLIAGEITREPSNTFPVGQVMRQDLPPLRDVERNSVVNIVISSGTTGALPPVQPPVTTNDSPPTPAEQTPTIEPSAQPTPPPPPPDPYAPIERSLTISPWAVADGAQTVHFVVTRQASGFIEETIFENANASVAWFPGSLTVSGNGPVTFRVYSVEAGVWTLRDTRTINFGY